MRALGKAKPGPGVSVLEIPEPEVRPGHVIMEVKYAAVCGGDLHWYHWGEMAARRTPQFPWPTGHECAGVVVEVGEGVTGLKVGDRIAVETHIPCGYCRLCLTGRPHNCENIKIFGIDTFYSAFCERTLVPQSIAVKIPDNVDLRHAACFEPSGVAFHAVMRADIRPGDYVVVFGCGPIGLAAQQFAHISGAATVIAVELSDYRLEMARAYGNVQCVNARTEDVVARIKELTGGQGVDKVIELSGAKAAFDNGLAVLSKSGTLVQVGGGFPGTFEFLPLRVVQSEITITGSFGREMFDTWSRLGRLVAAGRFDVERLITHELPYDQVEEGFELLASGKAGKVLFYP